MTDFLQGKWCHSLNTQKDEGRAGGLGCSQSLHY